MEPEENAVSIPHCQAFFNGPDPFFGTHSVVPLNIALEQSGKKSLPLLKKGPIRWCINATIFDMGVNESLDGSAPRRL